MLNFFTLQLLLDQKAPVAKSHLARLREIHTALLIRPNLMREFETYIKSPGRPEAGEEEAGAPQAPEGAYEKTHQAGIALFLSGRLRCTGARAR
jgi:hypothetical protein